MGGSGLACWGISLLSSLMLSAAEYALAGCLVLFLCVLGLIEPSRLPTWIPADWLAGSAVLAWGLLVGSTLLRCFAILGYNQSGHLLLGIVRARLKFVLGYELLRGDRPASTALGSVQFRMAEVFPLASNYLFHFTQLVSSLVLAVIIGMGMVIIAWVETLLGIAALAVVSVIIFRIHGVLVRTSAKIPAHNKALSQTLVRIVKNWMLIRVLGITAKEHRTYINSVKGYFRLSLKSFFLTNVSQLFPPLAGIVAASVIVVANLKLTRTPGSELIAFLYLFLRFTEVLAASTERIGLMHTSWPLWKGSISHFASFSRRDLDEALAPSEGLVKSLLTRRGVENDERTEWSGRCEEASRRPPTVEVRHLTFSWPGATEPVFEDLSLTIEAGSHFGIVGPNGVGKSTLLANILGIVQPSSGSVTIDGLESRRYVETRYDSIAYVCSDPCLIPATIRQNLVYGAMNESSSTEIWDQLELVGMSDVVRSLPSALDYNLAGGESGLSSGQAQRLALARAFLRKPSLLVLDEAASNLDRAFERSAVEALEAIKGACTVISVSHKPQLLSRADHVLDMGKLPPRRRPAQGRLVAIGGDVKR